MITECRTYLENLLNEIGIKRVTKEKHEKSQHQIVPRASISLEDETLERDGSLVARLPGVEPNEIIYRRRTYKRNLQMHVMIVAANFMAAEHLGEMFMNRIVRRIFDNKQNAILIVARSAEPDDDTSQLSRNASVAYLVTFHGGIYRDKKSIVYNLEDALELEAEILGGETP